MAVTAYFAIVRSYDLAVGVVDHRGTTYHIWSFCLGRLQPMSWPLLTRRNRLQTLHTYSLQEYTPLAVENHGPELKEKLVSSGVRGRDTSTCELTN